MTWSAGSTEAHKDTTRLLADALHLIGPTRAQFEAVARGRDPGDAGPGAAAAATRTLPRDIASFTGRQQELEQLAEVVAGAGGVVSIHAIGGMAGVGKTAFAVHAAHRLADGSRMGTFSCRCTGTRLDSSRSTRPTHWPACC